MLRELHGYDETSSCHAGQLTEPAIILVGRGILTRLVVPGTVFSSTHEAERLLLELGNALAQPTCRLEEIDIARSKHMAGIPLDHLFPEGAGRSLRDLKLEDCGWSGGFPQHMAGCTELTSLKLYDNPKLTGPIAPYGRFVKLRTLELNAKAMTGDLSDLAGLTKLHELWIAQCALGGRLQDLASLCELRVLSIEQGERVGGSLAGLSSIAQLRTLRLTGCAIEGDVAELAALSLLHEVHLLDCIQLQGQLAALAPLKDLTLVTLQGCPQVGRSRAALSHVKVLGRMGAPATQNHPAR